MLEKNSVLGGTNFRNVAAAAGLALVATVLSAPSMAADATGSFTGCTNNFPANVAIAEAQMSVDVTDIGSGQVQFDLKNTGTNAAHIGNVYFSDGNARLTFVNLIDADDGVGGNALVNFSQGSSPGDLPGGNDCTPSFQVTADLLADADSPSGTNKNGVDPGEELGLIFGLTGAFANVLADLESGALRVGIHVQGIGTNGQSEGLVSNFTSNMNEVAEPGTFALFGFGLVGLGYARRRRLSASMRECCKDNA